MFGEAARVVEEKSLEYTRLEPELLRELDPQQRIVFAQLAFQPSWLSTTDLRRLLGLSDRTVRERVKRWIADGFLTPRDEQAERVRSVTLGPRYRELASHMAKEPDRYRYLVR